jgi:plasmid maintenance system antidote protein VapI
MPKEPKLVNKRNPLRVLREVLSENGKDEPITQKELAKIILVPENTIRAIEAGQRKLGKSRITRTKIIFETGAYWDNKRKEWAYSTPDGDDPPFSRDLYLEFQQRMTKRPPNDVAEFHKLVAKLRRVFEKIPDERWHRLFFSFQGFIEEAEIEEFSKSRN